MAMSANAVRALEQVKMGLYMLYGADYFTEDEWIKIDGLIHKGKYVLTQGPSPNVLENADEPLMSFDDPVDDQPPEMTAQSADNFKLEPMTELEHQPSSLISEKGEASENPPETPNETSTDESSDKESSPSHPQSVELPTTNGFIDTAETTPALTDPEDNIPKREYREIPASGGLALGYTQAQLDELKAFNASLTKAGKKTRPKYGPIEETISPAWSYNDGVAPGGDRGPSPTATDHEYRIESWAHNVKAQDSTQETSSAAPAAAPNTKPLTHLENAKVHITPEVIDGFVKVHGRKPRSINDVFQPNNPGYKGPRRPMSRASTSRTAKSVVNPTAVGSKAFANALSHVATGTILVAQNDYIKNGAIQIEVVAGDKIKYWKHVSGVMHIGENLRNNKTGQFSESIFRRAPGAKKIKDSTPAPQQQPSSGPRYSRERMLSIGSIISNGLDRVEGTNAAEWDDMSMRSRPRTVAPAPIRPAGGLAMSRFAALTDDMKSQASSIDQIDSMTGMSREEVGRLVDEKFAQILAAQNKAPPTGPSRSLNGSQSDSLKPVPPKSATCWFWATPNKDCRFTADECRDLHSFVPSFPGDTTNLRMGKPTWGSLADAISPSVKEAIPTEPSRHGAHVRSCWYWANEGQCNNSADTCKYAHAYSPAGVATRPRQWKPISWDRWDSHRDLNGNRSQGDVPEEQEEPEQGEEGEEGELVLEEWGSGNAAASTGWAPEPTGWVPEPTGWEAPSDVYKPPHVKALEDKAKIEALGW